jgi:hypothetical protein
MLHLNNLGTLYFVLGTISLLRHLGFYQQKLKKTTYTHRKKLCVYVAKKGLLILTTCPRPRETSNAERRLKNVEVDKSTKYGLEFFSHLDT